jgi:hypothetical protein
VSEQADGSPVTAVFVKLTALPLGTVTLGALGEVIAQTVPEVPAQAPDEVNPRWEVALDTALFPASGSAVVDLLMLTDPDPDGVAMVQLLELGEDPEAYEIFLVVILSLGFVPLLAHTVLFESTAQLSAVMLPTPLSDIPLPLPLSAMMQPGELEVISA